MNGNFWIYNKISLQYATWCVADNMEALVQIMAWRRSGDKPLCEAMMVHVFLWRIWVSSGLNELIYWTAYCIVDSMYVQEDIPAHMHNNLSSPKLVV